MLPEDFNPEALEAYQFRLNPHASGCVQSLHAMPSSLSLPGVPW